MTQPLPTYNPNTPQFRKDSVADSQPQFLDNFMALFNAFNRNHVSLDAISGAGNHTVVELLQQGNPLQTDVDEIAIYTKAVAGQGDQAFFRYQGNGTEIQLSAYQIYTLSQTATPNSFFTFLPGNLLVYFGRTQATTGIKITIDLIPPVQKNIMTVSACALTQTTTVLNYKPSVSFSRNDKGFYSRMYLTYNGRPASAPATYYMVIANL